MSTWEKQQEQPAASGSGWAAWPSPIRDRVWVDADGIRWRLRGDGHPATATRVEHLLHSADAEVLLCYGPGAPTEVVPADREALWQRVRPYVRRPLVRAPDDHTDFRVAEFRDDRRRSLLVIEESC